MNDELRNIHRKKNMNMIVNFQNSNQGGTHWVAVIVKDNKNYYFDAYGNEPSDEIRKLLGNNIMRSTYEIQNYNTFSCGELSILTIYLLVVKHMNYIDIVMTMLDESEKYNKKRRINNNIGE